MYQYLYFNIIKTNIIYLYWTIYTDQFILQLHVYCLTLK